MHPADEAAAEFRQKVPSGWKPLAGTGYALSPGPMRVPSVPVAPLECDGSCRGGRWPSWRRRSPAATRSGGGAAGTVRRDPAPDRRLARTAHCGGLTGANHDSDGAKGRTMRRRLEEPGGRSREARGVAFPSFMRASLAPPAGLPIDERPFEEHRRTHEAEVIRGISGRGRVRLVAYGAVSSPGGTS